MPDKVELLINNKIYSEWVDYSVSSDVYAADTSFEVTIAYPDIDVNECDLCHLKVNDKIELTGTIGAIKDTISRGSPKITLTGHDLMGLVANEYCEEFGTFENLTIRALAEKFLRNIPYISRKNIEFENNTEKLIVNKQFTQVEPGARVFEVLSNAAASRGLLFYCKADGTLVFTKPKTKGSSNFAIIRTKAGIDNNVLSSERVRDADKRYRTIKIVGQQQGQDGGSAEDVNVEATVVDSTYPLKHKTFVMTCNEDADAPKLKAQLLMDKQKREALQLSYTVQGHSYAGANWAINEFCKVKDCCYNIEQSYLIYGREFSRSKTGGTTTRISLGNPGAP